MIPQALVSQLGYPLIEKAQFIQDIKEAIEAGRGYAAGKIGRSEKYGMYYPILLSQKPKPIQQKAFEQALSYHYRVQSGLFPSDPAFALRFNEFYMQHIKQIDCLGLFLDWVDMERDLIQAYNIQSKLIHYIAQEPDRSSPADESNCYLPHFRGQKLLLLCPFAEFLYQRANRETFEGVWSKTGQKWFYPASVDWLAFPYGYDAQTQKTFPTVLELYEHIVTNLNQKEFDVALIAAGGLAIPLASHIKSMGKVAISLGGHLQVLFGVYGARWRKRKEWQTKYFNEWWSDMPARYHPTGQHVSDKRAYW